MKIVYNNYIVEIELELVSNLIFNYFGDRNPFPSHALFNLTCKSSENISMGVLTLKCCCFINLTSHKNVPQGSNQALPLKLG